MTAPEQLDLVIFSIGARPFAADLTQVLRIDGFDPAHGIGEPLGRCDGRRALVFGTADDPERQLKVDAILGVRRVPVDSLRRMPRVVAPSPATPGAWLDGDVPVILVDLPSLMTSPRSA